MNLSQAMAKLFETLQQKTEEVLQKVQAKPTVKELIYYFTKSFNLSQFINDEIGYNFIVDALIKNLRKSPEHYQRLLNQAKAQIFQEIQEDENNILIKDYIVNEQSNYRAILLSKEMQEKQQIQLVQSIAKGFKQVFQSEQKPRRLEQKREELAQENKQKNSSKLIKIELNKQKSLQGREKENKKQQIMSNQKIHQINAQNIVVQVRYLAPRVKSDYKYDGYLLKASMEQFIRSNLLNAQIAVNRAASEITILDNTVFVKSMDAGNYEFDPFCGCVQIKIKPSQTSPNKSFSQSFRITSSEYEIKHKEIQKLEQWSRQSMNLSAESSVEEIVGHICEKRQENEAIKKQLAKALRQNGGAKKIQDMFSFEKQDFANLRIKPALIFQIQEVIAIIKENSKVQSLRDEQKEKRQCLKVANSHKILRYLVFKNQGVKGVDKIAWLNLKNLRNAINIVKKEIHNEKLLDDLENYFDQFALTLRGKLIPFSRGLILFGPPGTGKTVLTESLPNIMGFHLIEKGLSAADFNKSLVGQSARMIRDLVNRATYSPYLICSVAIDEVDGLVPDRKDKDQKNKAQGISMLLSVIGGNKDVHNLVFMTSTNYLKKIDEAIRRRLSGQYQVGRPNSDERQQIVKVKMEYFKLAEQQKLLKHLLLITTNFTGASLNGLCNYLLKNLRKQEMDGQEARLTTQMVTETAILIAKQYSITLGVYTIPEIYMLNLKKKHIFTENFLNNISNRIVLIKFDKNAKNFKMIYAKKTIKYRERMTEEYEVAQDFFELETKNNQDYSSFHQYVSATFLHYEKVIFESQSHGKLENYVSKIKGQLQNRAKTPLNKLKKTLMIIRQFGASAKSCVASQLNLLEKNMQKLIILYYMNPQINQSDFLAHNFPLWNSIQKKADVDPLSLKPKVSEKEPNYTGKIFVELNQDIRMAFELNYMAFGESKIAFKFFLRSENSNSPKDVIPELVNFFTKKKVSYILMLDYQLLLQNDAFQEKKQFEVLQEKMSEAKNYDKVAVLINLDSLITISENASDSSMGRSTSYSIVNHNMFQIIMNYIKQFAKISQKLGKWVCVIMRNKELINIVKKELSWPSYPEDDQRRKQEEQRDVKKKCGRCCAYYTDRTNQEEPKCMQHKGNIIDVYLRTMSDTTDVRKLRAELIKAKRKDKDSKKEKDKGQEDQNRYVYACCLKNLNEQGQTPYFHIEEKQLYTEDDEHYQEREKLSEKWEEALNLLI